MNELHLPVNRMYGSLMKYIDGGILPKMESYHNDYKNHFEEFVETRRRFITPEELKGIKDAILSIKLELADIWSKVADMQKEFSALKTDKDYETILLNYH